MNILPFDSEKYYLGKLCVHNHNWESTGQSLRSLGVKHYCLECQRTRARKYRANNPEKARESLANYRLTNKSRETQSKYYLTNKHREYRAKYQLTDNFRENQVRYKLTDKARETQAKYRETNQEKIRENQARHRKSEKYEQTIERRTQIREREFANQRELYPAYSRFSGFTKKGYTVEQVRARFFEFNNCCAYCKSERNLTIDHFIATHNGGFDSLDNIVPACASCNSSKNASGALEWYQKKKFYSQKQWDFILSILMKDGKNDFLKWLYPID